MTRRLFPCRSRLVGVVKPLEEKGVEVSLAAERRTEVLERQLASHARLFSLPRVVPRAPNIQRVGRNFGCYRKKLARVC
jgi:hypothetical protein